MTALGRAVLGSEETIRGMPRSVLTGYMGRNYSHGNIVVAATGKLEHAAILDLVGRHFSDLPTGTASPFESGVFDPPKRVAGIKVADVDELVAKLKALGVAA